MKKFILSVLAFVLALCCALGMVACGDSNNSNNSDNTDNSGDKNNTDDKESGDGDKTEAVTEVTVDEWVQILSSVDNFTAEVSVGDATQTMKMDGAKRLLDVNMVGISITTILSKEDGSYYQYTYINSAWTKTVMEEDMLFSYNYQAQLVSMFKDDFESFTYSDGKYFCSSLDKRFEMDSYLSNIKIVFADGKLKSIEYVANDENFLNYKYYDIDTTVIELPTDYVDNTTDNTPAVAGKTYMFSAFEYDGDDIDDEMKAMIEDSFKDSYYAFGNDGSVTANKSIFVMSDSPKYEQTGNEIRIYTYPDTYPSVYWSFTYNDDEIVFEKTIEGTLARYIYRLQTAD